MTGVTRFTLNKVARIVLKRAKSCVNANSGLFET